MQNEIGMSFLQVYILFFDNIFILILYFVNVYT